MIKNYMSNPDKFFVYMARIWKNAVDHGWHETPLSSDHYLGLIMTEVSEAIEADRNRRIAYPHSFKKDIKLGYDFKISYNQYIKGSIEEEFADIVIRILDMVCELYGSKMHWAGYNDDGSNYQVNRSFVENAWIFVKANLGISKPSISDSISFMYAWADYLDIDLDQQIEWKMKYNELRPYKHGGKRY